MRILIIVLGTILRAYSSSWNLNDVSYLFPLPSSQSENSDELLGPTSQGLKGVLLPDHIYVFMPTLLPTGLSRTQIYQKLRVVAVRIDPCPALYADGKTCGKPEVRMVWQVVDRDKESGVWNTQDAALHTFYRLELAEFDGLKEKLWQLKVKGREHGVSTEGKALYIHPAFANLQYAQSFRTQLQKILLQHAGTKNLFKATFMSLVTDKQWWRFGGLELLAGQFKQVKIPRLGDSDQDLFNNDTSIDPSTGLSVGMDGSMTPWPVNYPGKDNLHDIINSKRRLNVAQTFDLYRNKLSAVNRFANPHLTNPNNLDCASCHFADATKFFIGNTFPALADHGEDRYSNPDWKVHDLSNLSIVPFSTKIVRALGYFGDRPAISQRSIHDSAESAHFLNNSP